MKDFVIFTDGDVDLPDAYLADISYLPQYYYFDESIIYGDEKKLTRDEFLTSSAGSGPIRPASIPAS